MCGVSSSTGVTVLDNVVMFTLFAATRSIDIHKPGCADLDANGQFVKKIGECMHVAHETSLKSLRLRDLLTFGYLWLPILIFGFTFPCLKEPYWALLGLTGLYFALLNLTGSDWSLLGHTEHYWALLGLTGPYWALLGLTRPY